MPSKTIVDHSQQWCRLLHHQRGWHQELRMSLLSRAEEYLKQAEDHINLLGNFDQEDQDEQRDGGRTFRGAASHRPSPQQPFQGFNSRLPRVSAADIPSRSLSISLLSLRCKLNSLQI
jgi:hypothetical protein